MPTGLGNGTAQPSAMRMSSTTSNYEYSQQSSRPKIVQSLPSVGGKPFRPFPPPRPDPQGAVPQYPQYFTSQVVNAAGTGTGTRRQRPYSHIMKTAGADAARRAKLVGCEHDDDGVSAVTAVEGGDKCRHPGQRYYEQQQEQEHQQRQQLKQQQQQESQAGAEAPPPRGGPRHHRPSDRRYVVSAHHHHQEGPAGTHRRLVSGDQASSSSAAAPAITGGTSHPSHHQHHRYCPTGAVMSMQHQHLHDAAAFAASTSASASSSSPTRSHPAMRLAGPQQQRHYTYEAQNYYSAAAAAAAAQDGYRRASEEEAAYQHRTGTGRQGEGFTIVPPSAAASRIVAEGLRRHPKPKEERKPGDANVEDNKVCAESSSGNDQDLTNNSKNQEDDSTKTTRKKEGDKVVANSRQSSSRDEMYENALLLASLANAPVVSVKKKRVDKDNDNDEEDTTDDSDGRDEKHASSYSTPENSPARPRPSTRELRFIDIGPALPARGQDRAALSLPSIGDDNGSAGRTWNEAGAAAAAEDQQRCPPRRQALLSAPNNPAYGGHNLSVPRMPAAAAAAGAPRAIVPKPNIVTPVLSERPFVEDSTKKTTVQHLHHRHRITDTFPPPDSLFYEEQQNGQGDGEEEQGSACRDRARVGGRGLPRSDQRGQPRRRSPLPPPPHPASLSGSGGYYISMRPSPDYYGTPRSSPQYDASHSPEAVTSGGGGGGSTPPRVGAVAPRVHQLSPPAIFRPTTKRQRADDGVTSGRDTDAKEMIGRRRSRPRHNSYVPPPPPPPHPLITRMPYHEGATPPLPLYYHDQPPAHVQQLPHLLSARLEGDVYRQGGYGAYPSHSAPPHYHGLHAHPSPPPGTGYHLHAPPPPHCGPNHHPEVQPYNNYDCRRYANEVTVVPQHNAAAQKAVENDSIYGAGRMPPEYIGKTVITKAQKWAWKDYPELEAFLVTNRDEYLRHSAMRYTPQQKQFNNHLTDRLLALAHRHNYVFHSDDFDFTAIRDRIRCYYKSYVQSNKKKGLIVSYPPLRSVRDVRQKKMDAKVDNTGCEENKEHPTSGPIACATASTPF
mmetsp:Transcript_5269/g.11526  ORF Transcript_5269/g.11526 Transcript_5269/m.11526 type:complete len:1060 (-) Transcript_5269:83-3262(-)